MKNLREMKVDELKDIAREYTITGAWKMAKDKLIAAILENAKINGHDDRYYDGDAAETEITEETKIPEDYEATIIDGTLVAVSKTENITEAHENDPEPIETEDNKTNQDAQENEPEMNVAGPTHTEEKATPKRGALLAFNGKEQNICAWTKELGISANTLYGRIYKMGWTVEKAFTTPARKK